MTDPAVETAAASALELIRDGMRVGLGTGHGALAFLARLREDQVHDVVGAAREQPAAQIVVDDVVGGRYDIGQAHPVGGVVESVERAYLHALWHSPGHPGRVARIPTGPRRASR